MHLCKYTTSSVTTQLLLYRVATETLQISIRNQNYMLLKQNKMSMNDGLGEEGYRPIRNYTMPEIVSV